MKLKTVIETLLNKGGGRLSLSGSDIEDLGRVDARALFRDCVRSLGLKQTEWVFAFRVEVADHEFPILEAARVYFTVARIPAALALELSLASQAGQLGDVLLSN